MIENPPSFVVRTELHKAAFDNGFRITLEPLDSGWLHFRSTTAQGDIWLAAYSNAGPWLLTVGLAAIATELVIPPEATSAPGTNEPAGTMYSFNALNELHDALARTYRLGVSLPDAPLKEFIAKTMGVPRTTEAERLIVQRIGQDVFRQALLKYWNGCCPLTGITDPALLRASHIVPWAECETDAHRLDVHNGLLLSALWDAAFDAGLVSFDDAGTPLLSLAITEAATERLNARFAGQLKLTDAHRGNLARHRVRHGFIETARNLRMPNESQDHA
jgi:hypothetical protein